MPHPEERKHIALPAGVPETLPCGQEAQPRHTGDQHHAQNTARQRQQPHRQLAGHGQTKVTDLHRATVAMVKAGAQARAAAVILPLLTEDERTVYKRGRNSHVNSVPRGATMAEYHAATALEAVFGWLYLGGEADRARELFNEILKSQED